MTRWRNFKEAKEYVRSLKFNNPSEYKIWATTIKRPYDIPSTPHRDYKSEWTNWTDFLGTKLSYEEAKEAIKPLGIKTSKEYLELGKANLPRGVPSNASRTFTARGEWISWDDYLGRTK